MRGVGVEWARTVTNTYSLTQMRDALREALTTREKGPKVMVAQSECMLNRQRRVRPLMRKRIADGHRVVRERFGVDSDTCTGDHSCIRLSGCPSLTISAESGPAAPRPGRDGGRQLASAAGLCGEVAHAAVLCPSFYRAAIIHNPTRVDRFVSRLRLALIGWLQRRIDRRLRGLAA